MSQIIPKPRQYQLSKIDKSTPSINENGLHQFYEKYTEFLTKLRAEKLLKAKNEEILAKTLNDLKSPFIYCSYLFEIAKFIYLVEFVVFNYRGIFVE